MRRVWIAVILSIAFVAPGVALKLAREPRPPVERQRQQRLQEREAAVEQRLRSRRNRFGLDLAAQGACVPSFGTDISSLFFNAPGNGWVVVPHDCSATPGCDDYFVLTCLPGDLVQASFCSNGGNASWDTDLSVWTGGTLELCDDDTCGQQSAIAYATNGALYQRYRIGGAAGGSGSYSLAVNVPASCLVGPPIGVELQGIRLD